MGKKSILIVFIMLVILNGCSLAQGKGYTIKETFGKDWSFAGGELLFKGGEEEIKYSIDYIGNNKIDPIGLTFEFLIFTKNSDNKNDIKGAEHLHSNINGYLGKKVDNNYSKKDSFKGDFLDSEKEYSFESLYLRITYEADGRNYEEVIKLPMEKKQGK